MTTDSPCSRCGKEHSGAPGEWQCYRLEAETLRTEGENKTAHIRALLTYIQQDGEYPEDFKNWFPRTWHAIDTNNFGGFDLPPDFASGSQK